MTPIPRPCLACGQATTNGSRCPACTTSHVRAREARRPTFQQRRGTDGWTWASIRAGIRQRDGNRCTRCGATSRLQVHHRIPIAQGGTNHPDNLETLCAACHGAAHRF